MFVDPVDFAHTRLVSTCYEMVGNIPVFLVTSRHDRVSAALRIFFGREKWQKVQITNCLRNLAEVKTRSSIEPGISP
jgi:hypothetical protein